MSVEERLRVAIADALPHDIDSIRVANLLTPVILSEVEQLNEERDRHAARNFADKLAETLPQRCAPTEEEVEALLFSLYDHGTSPNAKREARAIASIYAAQPTVREAKAAAWDEGKATAVNAHPSWWRTLTNPYRSEADHGC